jgi:hypothetical protein
MEFVDIALQELNTALYHHLAFLVVEFIKHIVLMDVFVIKDILELEVYVVNALQEQPMFLKRQHV